MTDLDRLLTDVLHEDALRAPPPREASTTFRRVRRRQAAVVASAATVVIATVVGAALGAAWLLGREPVTPAGAVERATEHGVSITYPRGWVRSDQIWMGIADTYIFPSEVRYPRTVLGIAPTGRMDPSCPARGGGQAFLTIERTPLTLNGPGARSWPVTLEPTSAPPSSSASCTTGWRYWSAEWTTGGRSFAATAGVGPAATSRDLASVRAAFASLRFDEGTTTEGRVVALLDGTTDGEHWYLLAMRKPSGPELFLVGHAGGGSGIGGGGASDRRLRAVFDFLGPPGTDTGAYFGLVPPGTARLEVRNATVAGLAPRLLDVPSSIAPRDAFFMPTPPGVVGRLIAIDAQGRVIGHYDIGGPRWRSPANATT